MVIKQNCIDYLKSTDNKCCGCGSCSNACPAKAISMTLDSKGFIIPVIDQEKCVNCGICKAVCPIFVHIERKTSKNQTKPQIIVYFSFP